MLDLLLRALTSRPNPRLKIYADITAERIRQNVKFTGSPDGSQRHNLMTWGMVLAEECGEAIMAANDYFWAWQSGKIATPEQHAALFRDLRTELVQTAASAVAMIERLDAADQTLMDKVA